LRRNWQKVKKHIGHPEVQALLVGDFHRYTWGRWRSKFEPGMLPTQFESCDWQCERLFEMTGSLNSRPPAFWSYTKHAACHWLTNFALRLAQLVEPERPWRIITSQKHSTVWDGEHLLFDFNFQAMGIEPDECFERAHEEELKPGEYMRVHLAAHCTWDMTAEQRRAPSAFNAWA
jgi:hypothetical protein